MENKTYPSDIWSGALIAVGLVILQGFFSSNTLDASSLVSTYAFAFALPILSCNVLTNFVRKRSGKKTALYEILFYSLGIFASLVGIDAAFWHICWIVAVIFAVSSLSAFVIFLTVSHQ